MAGAGVGWDMVAGSRLLTGGTFNAVYLVSLADGTRLVVKIPPGPETPLLRYEQGILATEALYYQLAGQWSLDLADDVVGVVGVVLDAGEQELDGLAGVGGRDRVAVLGVAGSR